MAPDKALQHKAATFEVKTNKLLLADFFWELARKGAAPRLSPATEGESWDSPIHRVTWEGEQGHVLPRASMLATAHGCAKSGANPFVERYLGDCLYG